MDIIKYTISIVPSSLAISGAIYLMTQGVGGWGWLLFVGLVLGVNSVQKDSQ